MTPAVAIGGEDLGNQVDRRGYIVVCRTTEEIKARQHMLAACDDQTESEEAMPF